MADDTIQIQHLTFKYRLLPSRAQHSRLRAALDHTRDLYNAALQERIWAWRKSRKHIFKADQYKGLTELRRDPDWSEYSAIMQRWPLTKADEAFASFFRRCKAGEKPGLPRFRSKERFKSFGFTDRQGNGWAIVDRRLRMKGIGAIRIRMHRPLPSKPITCRVKREGSNWYALLTVEVECAAERGGPGVGLDVGVAHLATLSTGEHAENVRCGDRLRRDVRRSARALSRRKRGSRRRQKAKERLARVKRREASARATHLHQVSADLARRFSIIVVEDLSLRNMTRSAKGTVDAPGKRVAQKSALNRALLDAAPGRLLQFIDYKAAKAGGRMIKVDARRTSQTCWVCDHVDPASRRSQSVFCCSKCGNRENADVNAARVIKQRAGVAVGEELNVAGCGVRAPGNICAGDRA